MHRPHATMVKIVGAQCTRPHFLADLVGAALYAHFFARSRRGALYAPSFFRIVSEHPPSVGEAHAALPRGSIFQKWL